MRWSCDMALLYRTRPPASVSPSLHAPPRAARHRITARRRPVGQRRELRNGRAREREVPRVFLHSYAGITDRFRRCERRARACEWIEHDTLAERQHAAHERPQEALRLQARMRREPALARVRRRRSDDVAERLLRRRSAETAGLPPAQIVLRPPFEPLAKEEPGLPHGPRHHAHAAELEMRR